MTEFNRRSFAAGAGAAGLALSAATRANAAGANDKIRIGVIGCGGRGNFLIGQVLRHQQEFNVEIAALCDVWTLNLNETDTSVRQKQRRHPVLLRRYHDLLNRRDIDAVIIATPDFAHTPILIDAVRAGKDVFCEKPMATVLAHANEAVDVVHASRQVVGIGNQRRSDARHQTAAEWFKTHPLGKVSVIDAAWNDNGPRWRRPFDNVRAEDIDWEQFLMYLPREEFRPERFRRWHFWKDMTVGTPALLGAHLIDVGCWFMDDPIPKSAVAHGGVYVWKDGREHADTINCIIEYPKEFYINYTTRLGNNRPTPEAIFYGTKGTFDTQSWTARGDSGGSDFGIVEPEHLTEPYFISDPRASQRVENSTVAGGQADPRVQNDDHMINFLQALRSRHQPSATVDVGYSHTVASIMCFESWKSGSRQVYDAATRTIRAG
ncbi:MAG TPA: Gfo/Idh/MocA family oxidoreductase [Caulobacterales bacterium]|nr:Gfo/Idh/MocA family oxidoreductase [Caulobacterales bacterium]